MVACSAARDSVGISSAVASRKKEGYEISQASAWCCLVLARHSLMILSGMSMCIILVFVSADLA